MQIACGLIRKTSELGEAEGWKLPLTALFDFAIMGVNIIGQFVTILSVNKTRETDGRIAPVFCF